MFLPSSHTDSARMILSWMSSWKLLPSRQAPKKLSFSTCCLTCTQQTKVTAVGRRSRVCRGRCGIAGPSHRCTSVVAAISVAICGKSTGIGRGCVCSSVCSIWGAGACVGCPACDRGCRVAGIGGRRIACGCACTGGSRRVRSAWGVGDAAICSWSVSACLRLGIKVGMKLERR